jgi:DNA mismatch repair protein MutS
MKSHILVDPTTTLTQTYFDIVQEAHQEFGENVVVIMQVGSFFEVYGKSHEYFNGYEGGKIEEYARICGISIAEKTNMSVKHLWKHGDGKTETLKCKLMMCGYRDYQLDVYLDKMNEAGYTCVVYKQHDTDPSNKPRELLGIYTPGTYFKQDDNVKLNNNIMCVYITHKKPNRFHKKNKYFYGISVMNIINGTSNVIEHSEDYYKSLTTFDELEKFYSIYNPIEFLFLYHNSNIPTENIEKIAKYINIQSKVVRLLNMDNVENNLSVIASRCCEQIRQKEIIKFHFSNSSQNDEEYIYSTLMEYPCAANSYCFLLDYIYGFNSDLLYKLKTPQFNNNIEYMVLANHSLVQLNYISDSKRKLASVVNFLNNCITPMGKRELHEQLVKPIINVEKLNKMYDIIEYFKTHFDSFKNIRNNLQNVFDIEKLIQQISVNRFEPSHLYNMYSTFITSQEIMNNMNSFSEINTFYEFGIIEKKKTEQIIKENISFIEHHFNITILQDKSCNVFERNIFNRGIHPDIDIAEQKYIESIQKLQTIQKYFSECIQKSERKTKNNDFCKLHRTEKSGFFLKMTDSRAKKLLKELEKQSKQSSHTTLKYISDFDKKQHSFNFQIDNIEMTKKGKDIYIHSPFIQKTCNAVDFYMNEMNQLMKETFNQIIHELLERKSELYIIVHFLIQLDIYLTKAYTSIKYNYCKPTICVNNNSDVSYFKADELRHVLIEHINQDEIYVPNTIQLGSLSSIERLENKTDKNNNCEDGILLYGTNAVGKSSLIKSIGIAVMMAQSGFYVPAKNFEFSPFHSIFTRILGNDNIFKGLSTFAVEMSELRTILKQSNEYSLVLGDELCSGTELGSAISIFVSGLQQLHNRKSKFIFATHFHEITNMEEIERMERLKMKHMSVYYDESDDCLVYDRKLKDGPGNNMYGLEVCKALNLPQDFIEQALSIRKKREDVILPPSEYKKSHFNAKKLVGMCEMCGKKATEVHHLQYQQDADGNNIIGHFHKDHIGNLLNICESCHNDIHRKHKKIKRKKTTKGIKLVNSL